MELLIGIDYGLSPCPVTATTRIIIFSVGDSYKPSFATVTGRGCPTQGIDESIPEGAMIVAIKDNAARALVRVSWDVRQFSVG